MFYFKYLICSYLIFYCKIMCRQLYVKRSVLYYMFNILLIISILNYCHYPFMTDWQ